MADDDIKPGAEGEDIEAEVAPDGVNASQTDAEAESADSVTDGVPPSASDSETADDLDDLPPAATAEDEAEETTEAAGTDEGETPGSEPRQPMVTQRVMRKRSWSRPIFRRPDHPPQKSPKTIAQSALVGERLPGWRPSPTWPLC